MKSLTIRDVIGPVMVGPSSSHTAGALRIALTCRKLLDAAPVRARFELYGSFAHTYRGHGTDKALVAGLLGMPPEDLRVRESFEIARAEGLSWEFVERKDATVRHPNTVEIEVEDALGNVTRVRGESIGGGAAVISQLNGIDVELTGEFHSLVVKQHDVPGVLAAIARTVCDFGVNIATTKLFREKRGEDAYTIMETDEEIPAAVRDTLLENPEIYAVKLIKSDRASDALPPVTVREAGARCLVTDADGCCSGFGADLTANEAVELFEALDFATGAELLAYCEREGVKISDAICRRERASLAASGIVIDDTKNYLFACLDVMRASIDAALTDPKRSMGGLIGGEAKQLATYGEGGGLCDPLLARATCYSMAVLETNASMGRIVAAPTAGSSGVVPGMLFALQDERGLTDEQLERGLANAAAIGYLITCNACVAGAEGGCQAEVGAASAMAASAAVELMGGSPAQCLAAATNAIAGLLGLVCDPIAGLVEAPCQKRNATGVANALVSAQMALAGVATITRFDETVDAMYAVGRALPMELRETALGGLAATPSACSFCTGCASGACR